MIEGMKGVFNALFRKGIVGEGFYWDGSGLGKLVNRLSNPDDAERKLIRELLRRFEPENVLDIACGPATELRSYLDNGIGAHYVGLDKSTNMLAIAKERFPDTPFVRADAQYLPFGNNSFDAIIMKHVLEHLPGYERAVSEAVKVSRDIVIIDFFHKLLPADVPVWNSKGFWDNWYSRCGFERFLRKQPISYFEKIRTDGTHGNTAEIYLLKK